MEITKNAKHTQKLSMNVVLVYHYIPGTWRSATDTDTGQSVKAARFPPPQKKNHKKP